MGYITWTKSWSASDNGTVFGGVDFQNIQSDIATAVNGGLSNTNVASGAAIEESKVLFSGTGHAHGGGTDGSLVTVKHYIKGGKLTRTSATVITVGPITIDVGGTVLTKVSATTIDVTTAANWLTPDGGAQGDEPADDAIFVYAWDNAGTIGFLLGDENAAPTLSFDDATTAEYPLRYIKDDGAVYYRCVGTIHNRGDLMPDMICYMDRGYAKGSVVGDGNTEVINTGWTPQSIRVVQMPDSTPAATENIKENFIDRYGFATANPHPLDLNYSNQAGITDLIDEDVAGSITAITPQAAGTSGGFSIYEPVNTAVVRWEAWTDEGA